jgi:hypothetical protein
MKLEHVCVEKLTKHRWNNYFWRFTLVLIKINYGQIGDQTGLFHTTNPVFYTSGNRFGLVSFFTRLFLHDHTFHCGKYIQNWKLMVYDLCHRVSNLFKLLEMKTAYSWVKYVNNVIFHHPPIFCIFFNQWLTTQGDFWGHPTKCTQHMHAQVSFFRYK